MIYGYARVSTRGQLEGNSIEDQIAQIKAIYSDAEIIIENESGAAKRLKFDKLLKELSNGDMLVVTKLDRFCRKTKEGLSYIDYLLSKNVKIHILNMGLIEDSPMGRLIVTNLLAFAEFERSMIYERTQAGKAIAKTKPGYREGRPKKFTPEQISHAIELLTDHSYKQVSSMTGISKSTLIRARCTL